MKRKDKFELPPLDPSVKAAGKRVLEKAFGEFSVKGGTPTDLRKTIEREIAEQKPRLRDDPEAISDITRLFMSRFFEIVADEPGTPSGKKYDQIIKNFVEESTAKYRTEHPDSEQNP